MKYVAVDEEVKIPEDVSVKVEDKVITLEGKKGKVIKDLSHMKKIDIKLLNKTIYLHIDFPRQSEIAKIYTVKNIIGNMIKGVQEGYEYRMKIVYSHFPITVDPPKGKSDEILIKNFIGERAPRVTKKIGDVTIKSNKEEVIVSGPNKEHVGQTCANIQKLCKIREKDKRIFQDGVYVYKKLLGDEVLWEIR
ncbi:MAG: 50S ribosomal protein L6 [Promethearchaeia archaeon]|nr:MAG: 50S ribosomal protein L6 [Candidatus Lokiarchaeia archaeon]